MNEFKIRSIKPDDNQSVKRLVLETLAEFGLDGAGYAGVDIELEDMYSAYNNELSAFYVIEKAAVIYGIGGYAPLLGTQPGTIAELRKMYFQPALRGMGMGQRLIELCIKQATKVGYQTIYLETVPTMKAAQSLYLKNGFKYLEQRLGDTGHSKCHVYMSRALNH